MSEIKKNIETCRGEDVLAEVSAAPQDPHFGSLVNEALDPLKQQALHQAGYDGYSEVIAQHKPYTFASAVIQMKSNLLLLLRALWQFPFGSGTLRSLSDDASPRSLSDDASLRSLADMWQHYITRLSGNETYGIPSRLSSLTDLPSAPLLLADRKISGVTEAEDGISLVHLLVDNSNITELTDDNRGWELPSNVKRDYIFNTFAAVTKLTLGCARAICDFDYYMPSRFTDIEFPDLKYYKHSNETYRHNFTMIRGNMENVSFPVLEYYAGRDNGYGNGLVSDLPNCKKFSAPLLSSYPNQDPRWPAIYNCPNLEEVDFSSLTAPILHCTQSGIVAFDNCQKLICIKFKEYTASRDLSGWNPTNALDASLDTLVTDEDCHNNLEQFLKNFRTYIALRLAAFASDGPTLTLSQAVYDAIKDESHLFVFDEGTMTIYAYLTNIKHWTVTK